jgi:glycerophosphoryl diester phosphodiesterase
MRVLDAVSLHTNHKHLTPDLIKEIKEEGYALFVYTINEVHRARWLLSLGVDALCTDNIAGFASQMKELLRA